MMTHRTPGRPHALVVAYHFAPDAWVGSMRTLRVVRQLVASEFDVTVLTGEPSTYRPGTPLDPKLLESVPAGVRIVRARSTRGFEAFKHAIKGGRRRPAETRPAVAPPADATPAQRSAFLRLGDVIDAALAIPDQESAWFASAVFKGVAASIRRAPDVIYSSAPPWTGHLVAHTLASALRRPWVADFRDPWGRAPWRGDRYGFANKAAHVLERFVIRRADQVLFVSRANRDEFAHHYGPELASKFRLVPNGCDVTEFEGLERQVAPGDPFVLLHAGSLYAGRSPMPLFAAIARGIREGAIDKDRFRVRFVGTNAVEAGSIGQMLRTLDLEQVVEFLPRVPRGESLQAITNASALLLLQPNHAVAVPAKLYEYLAAARPILAIATGETASLVEQSGLGVCAEGNEEGTILRALLQVMAMAGGPGRRPAPELFDGVRRATEMVAVISDAMRPPAQGLENRKADAVQLSRWSRT